MSRTRRCVLEALQQLAKQPNCTQLIYSNHLEQLDKCYEQDLLKLAELVKQRNELQFGKQDDVFCLKLLFLIVSGEIISNFTAIVNKL